LRYHRKETERRTVTANQSPIATLLSSCITSSSMTTLKPRMLRGVPNVVDSSAHKALDLLKALVRDEVECPVCLDTCSHTHIDPECLHRFCGDCIKEHLRKCNNAPGAEFVFLQSELCGKISNLITL